MSEHFIVTSNLLSPDLRVVSRTQPQFLCRMVHTLKGTPLLLTSDTHLDYITWRCIRFIQLASRHMALHVTQFNTCWSNGEYLSRVCTSHIMDTRASDAYFLVSCVVPTHRPALAITCGAHVSCKHVTCSHTCLCHRQRAPHSRYPSSLPSCWLTQCRVSNCRSRHSRSRLRVWKDYEKQFTWQASFLRRHYDPRQRPRNVAKCPN